MNTYPWSWYEDPAIADFLKGVETGTPAEPTFRTALQTQRVCDAILRSAKNGAWVETNVQL